MRNQPKLLNQRILWISGLCIVLGVVSAFTAHALIELIGLITNITFYGRLSTSFISPAANHLGLWVIPIPMIGGLIVGGMARWGSKAIRGHGIPEAMEQVLRNESRIPARITWLKPLSSAIAIGTGGPFGAEGPIIATGGALIDTRGNLIGINTAIYSNNGGSMGIGFAIPINLTKQIMESILANGSVTRGWIGVEPQNLTKELSESLGLPENTVGVLLSGVLEGGPAERGGLKPGDILTAVNESPIRDVRGLLNQIAQINPGNQAKLMILRKGKEIELTVQAGRRPGPKLLAN